jgi:hypothetical protein
MFMLENLIEYAQSNHRVCPQPTTWNTLWEMLPDGRLGESGWVPSPPLILAAWWTTPPLFKILRVREHIEYAAARGALPQVDAFLRALPETDWAHFEDFGPGKSG